MKKIALLILIAAAFAGGYGYGRWYGKPASAARQPLYWVDPMHPWYKSDKPGTAPDCGMKLVPVYAGDESKQNKPDVPPGTVEISPDKQQLAGMAFTTVEYRDLAHSIRAAARVALDETRVSKVQSKIEGWIDQVFVDFTGKTVKAGDPLLTIYSPEALATQQEYLLALKARGMTHEGMRQIADSTERLVGAARKRLELWDIGAAQIDRLERTGETLKNLTLVSPVSGSVMERNAFPGQRVTSETVLYTVADLSSAWVMADVYEYEAAGVKLDQPASLTLTYLPGRVFRGRVTYIQPQVDPATRTLKVRLQFDNPGHELKPDMYGEVELQTGGGRRLAVPQSAVLNSGDRQTVFVDRGNGSFEPRQVGIGAESDGMVEILSGRKAGERIVTAGNFLIDSESQMKAPAGGKP